MAFMVSSVAAATLRLLDNAAARENWFFRISCAARRAARCALLLRDRGRMALRALAASVSSWPLFQSSRRVVTSVLTAIAEAPGFSGPRTKVGKRNRASQAASRRVVPQTSAALVSKSVITGSSWCMLSLGMLTDDWHPDVLRNKGVKSGWEQQNSTPAECGGVL